jgi:hypothetical protein
VAACHLFRVMRAVPGSVSLVEVRMVFGDMANQSGTAERTGRRGAVGGV